MNAYLPQWLTPQLWNLIGAVLAVGLPAFFMSSARNAKRAAEKKPSKNADAALTVAGLIYLASVLIWFYWLVVAWLAFGASLPGGHR